MSPLKVLVWGEYTAHERVPEVQSVYPDGVHAALAAGLREQLGSEAEVRVATLDQPDCGLGPQALGWADVLVWWGHRAHGEVPDAVAEAVQQRVLFGMGFIAVHSSHFSKPFRRLMGTTCSVRWREDGEREVIWTVNPTHPIARGVPRAVVIPQQEMYGEYFDIPQPDELVFISSFGGGEVVRSGCCFYRGRGRVFYFSPGHETYPVFDQDEIRLIIANAVGWAAVAERPDIVVGTCERSARDWFVNPDPDLPQEPSG